MVAMESSLRSEDFSIVVNLQLVTYVTVSFFSLMTYDWITSLEREVTRIWCSKWSLVKVLYLYAKYAPFVSMSFAVHERFSSTCGTMTFTTLFAGATIVISDVILMLRTYSIYNKSRKILAIFGLSLIIGLGVAFWSLSNLTDSFHLSDAMAHVSSSSCFLAQESTGKAIVCYVSLFAGEAVIGLLTFWKTVDSYRKSGSLNQIISMVYCEGLFYYFLIIPLTFANTLVIIFVPEGLKLLLDSPLTVMHSILCCRLVLHIREVSDYNTEDETEGDDILPASVIEMVSREPYMSTKVQQHYV